MKLLSVRIAPIVGINRKKTFHVRSAEINKVQRLVVSS